MKNNEQEVLAEDQAARQHQPPVPAPDCPTGGGDGYGEVLAISIMGHHHQPWSGYSGADSLPCYAAQTVCPGAVRYKDPCQGCLLAGLHCQGGHLYDGVVIVLLLHISSPMPYCIQGRD